MDDEVKKVEEEIKLLNKESDELINMLKGRMELMEDPDAGWFETWQADVQSENKLKSIEGEQRRIRKNRKIRRRKLKGK